MNIEQLNEEILEWHKTTFPLCTVESQLLKLDEELKEVIECVLKSESSQEELADAYIVSLVLAKRYKSTIGGYFVGLFSKEYTALWENVKKKMEINKMRKWKKVEGVYRHEEELKPFFEAIRYANGFQTVESEEV